MQFLRPDAKVNPGLTRRETAKLAVMAHSYATEGFGNNRHGDAADGYELAAKLCRCLERTEDDR